VWETLLVEGTGQRVREEGSFTTKSTKDTKKKIKNLPFKGRDGVGMGLFCIF
jgi:hypothetical protein